MEYELFRLKKNKTFEYCKAAGRKQQLIFHRKDK